MKILFLFSLLISPISSFNRENYFKVMLNMFRSDPLGYKNYFNVDVNCNRPLNAHYDLLYNSVYLDNSSLFQASTLSFDNCSTIDYSTCDLYCQKFNDSCNYKDRINSFLPKDSQNIFEVFSRGPKQMRSIFNLFLNSPHHCDILLNPDINSVGASFQSNDKNIFVGDFANIPVKHNNSLIVGYYNNLNNITSFYVNTLGSLEVYVIINDHVSYRMNPYFNSYFFGLRLNYSLPTGSSYYFTDLYFNSTTSLIE